MSSILGKATLPAAVTIVMLSFIGALGAGSVRTAQALEGDVCQVYTNAPSEADFDGQGNTVYLVDHGETYAIVFRIEDDAEMNLISVTQTQDDTVVGVAWSEWDLAGENTEVRIDSETGSARITSKAEILDLEEQEREIPGTGVEDVLDVPDVGHTLITPPVATQTLDTISPRFFNDSDGNALDDIGDWLLAVGYEDFVGDDGDDPDVCGDDTATETEEDCEDGIDCTYTDYLDDSWGFFDFECIEPGYFHVDILTPDDTEETGQTLKFFCGGQAETATIAASPTTVETDPVGGSVSSSIVLVAVEDQFGDRIDGVEVVFITDNCKFSNPLAGDPDDFGISPAGGGTTVNVYSDTDSLADSNFLTDNPLEHSAGTAEVSLDCATGKPGTAHVTAIVERPGSDIVLTQDVKVVGPTAVSGLTLTLTPDELECGETLLAEATAVDAAGAPVSDGTLIRFTTDTSSGVVGGSEGAQGGIASKGGKASVHIATDPGNPGVHTVIAYATRGSNSNTIVAQTSQTYVCDSATLPAAPTPPPGSIVPPSTGDAGLASGAAGASRLVIAGAVAFVLAGLASLRFARS